MRAALCGCLCLVGCYSPGEYGYSRTYSALDAEEAAAEKAKDYDPVMAQRLPHEWQGQTVSAFGIVKSRGQGPAGTADLALGIHTLAERNLCEEPDEATCRVTVSEREFALVHALVKLSGQDEIGKNSVASGSLVRVIGVVGDEVGSNDGTPVIRAQYYRHWPKDTFVTTAARSYMLR